MPKILLQPPLLEPEAPAVLLKMQTWHAYGVRGKDAHQSKTFADLDQCARYVLSTSFVCDAAHVALTQPRISWVVTGSAQTVRDWAYQRRTATAEETG